MVYFTAKLYLQVTKHKKKEKTLPTFGVTYKILFLILFLKVFEIKIIYSVKKMCLNLIYITTVDYHILHAYTVSTYTVG